MKMLLTCCNLLVIFLFEPNLCDDDPKAIFKTRNGESRNGMERNSNGTRKAEIFKTRNEKSRNL